MSGAALVKEVLSVTPASGSKGARTPGVVLSLIGVIGLGIGFFGHGDPAAGWTALLVATVLTIGLGMVGPLLSAIFQMTGSKWGRAYRRVAEGSVALMPLGLVALVAVLVTGNAYLPWVEHHPHVGGKAVWLTRGFWDARTLGALVIAYGVGLAFVRLSLRRDFCLAEVRDRFTGPVGKLLAKGIGDPVSEAERCEKRMAVLAPIVCIVYALAFTLLGIDLIMALEPDWISTLFGAWYFIGNLFCGLALLAIGSVALARKEGMGRFFTPRRQSDLATLLLAFCLLNVDFFWNQYLTIWYANLPEETFYLIERTVDRSAPWRALSFVSLAAFFLIPFLALLIRRVKRNQGLLVAVASISLVGVFLARFIEVAPALLHLEPQSGLQALALPVASAALAVLGFLGAGLLLYAKWMSLVPIMPVNDEVFIREFATEEHH